MEKGYDEKAVNIMAHILIGFVGLATLLPFVMLVSSSFQPEISIIKYGYTLIAREFTLDAYKYIFSSPANIIRGYGISMFITVVGTCISLFLSAMAAYVLARKDVKYRNGMAFFIFFTTLFNAGLVPYYIFMIQYLHMKNSILALILPNLFNVMYILIMRTNIANNIPDSIPESAKIDGANDFSIYLKIILPLSKPVLASIGLFVTLMYWNDWWNAMLFITNDKIFPLQYILYRILTYSMYAQELLKKSGALVQLDMPKESLKLALTVITTGPIVLAYPFAQKYFVAGITIGAVKG